MTQFILGIVYAFTDVGRAIWHLLTRQRRGRYQASSVIAAPQAVVWDILNRLDITYTTHNLRLTAEPYPGHEGVLLAKIFQAGRELPPIAYRQDVSVAGEQLQLRYLRDLSTNLHTIGFDDLVTVSLTPVTETSTRLSYVREMTHATMNTRITAPLGLRTAIALTKSQAEIEAGTMPAKAPLWHQLIWTGLAFLSFAWLLDWRTAIAIMVIIAIHEAGHALAMWRYGLGVHFVSFIPFLGGVAAPKRYYETEWQKGIVALMGVGFSLPFTLLAVWLTERYNAPNLGSVAILSIIINAVNLIPFPALDGSAVVSMLLAKLHKSLSQFVTLAMFVAFFALGFVINDPLIWTAIAFSFVSVVQVMSIKADDYIGKMRWPTSLGLLAIYGLLIGAHLWAFMWATQATGRAEANLITACIREQGNAPQGVQTCREQHALWLLR
jgi:Zn-dependent protease